MLKIGDYFIQCETENIVELNLRIINNFWQRKILKNILFQLMKKGQSYEPHRLSLLIYTLNLKLTTSPSSMT